MTNVRCRGEKEIDLLAVKTGEGTAYHIEPRVGALAKFKG
jgi:hypothetical protein